MCGELVDGGAIYSLGHNPGSGYTHNYIHHQCRYGGDPSSNCIRSVSLT